MLAGELAQSHLPQGWCDEQAPDGLVVVVGTQRPAGLVALQPPLNKFRDGLVGHLGHQPSSGPSDGGLDLFLCLPLGVEGTEPSLTALSRFQGKVIARVPLAVSGVGPLRTLPQPIGTLCLRVCAPALALDATAHLAPSDLRCDCWVVSTKSDPRRHPIDEKHPASGLPRQHCALGLVASNSRPSPHRGLACLLLEPRPKDGTTALNKKSQPRARFRPMPTKRTSFRWNQRNTLLRLNIGNTRD